MQKMFVPQLYYNKELFYQGIVPSVFCNCSRCFIFLKNDLLVAGQSVYQMQPTKASLSTGAISKTFCERHHNLHNLSLCHVLLWGEALAIGHGFALVAYLLCATDLYTEDRTKWHFHALRSIFTWPQCVLTLCTVARQNWPNKMHKKCFDLLLSMSRSGTKRLNYI